jgi:hypothetical protein
MISKVSHEKYLAIQVTTIQERHWSIISFCSALSLAGSGLEEQGFNKVTIYLRR